MSHTVDSLKTYYLIFLALMVLTAVTVGAAFIDFGPLNISIAMAIAILKGCLVLWFFMHVRHGNPLLKIFAVAGFLWLVILVAFTLQDYVTRPWQDFEANQRWIKHQATHFEARAALRGNASHGSAH